MNPFSNAVQNYLGNQSSRIQESLESKEAGERGKQSLDQANEGLDVGMAESSFSDKLKEEGNKMSADMMTDISSAGLAPQTFKSASRLAMRGSSTLQKQWRITNARRQAVQDGLDPDEVAPEETPIRDVVENVGGRISEGMETVGNKIQGLRDTLQAQRDPQTQDRIMEQDPEEGLNAPTTTTTVQEPAETPTQNEIMDSDPEGDVSGLTRQADNLASQAGEEASNLATDLAPELTTASEGLASFGSVLGDAIPFVGFGLGAWALGQGIKDEVQSAKDSMSDPFGSVRSDVVQAQGKINNLESNISSDQFASKLGAGSPSFGSLASRPNLDTSTNIGIALHV